MLAVFELGEAVEREELVELELEVGGELTEVADVELDVEDELACFVTLVVEEPGGLVVG